MKNRLESPRFSTVKAKIKHLKKEMYSMWKRKSRLQFMKYTTEYRDKK